MKNTRTIEVGRKYDAYNDGKKSPSRLVRVVITDEATRKELSKRHISVWRKALKEDFMRAYDSCFRYWDGKRIHEQFWDWNCNQFYFAEIPGDEESRRDPMLVAKTAWGGWYCVNWNYEVDFAGKVRKNNLKMWKQGARECGEKMVWNRKTGRYDYLKLT